MPSAVVAAFDVDGTVTSRDCVVPFLRRVAGTVPLCVGLARRPGAVLGALVRRDRNRLKALASSVAFGDRALEAVDREAQAFATEVHDRHLRADVVSVLADHRRRGDAVVFVSASYELYLRPLAAALDVDGVVATRLEVDADGRLTGELDGPNCRAAEKVRRLHAWLAERGFDRTDVRVVAYGDSTGDRELLVDADEAHWVGRGRPPSWMSDQ